MAHRNLSISEIRQLESQGCLCSDWSKVLVKDGFDPSTVRNANLSGIVKLGVFNRTFRIAGGIEKHSGIFNATLHNVEIGDDCRIENIRNYIANYEIGHDVFIENVDIMLVDGESSFGNGVEVAVMNETGGREVIIYDRLSSQVAYILALYRYRSEAVEKIRGMATDYANSVKSSVGHIGAYSRIVDSGYLRDVRCGEYCRIEGTSRLKNGSINSTKEDPVHIGVGVIGDDFIVCSGACIEDGTMFSRCFIGQACRLGHGYTATDSLFFADCIGENGEACAIFAGPFTVTHHKSSLLIAGMFSFMNTGSGSNQSNHMYKLGPIHQGIMERGAKTASDSYILWPARVGAFSLVMGRHTNHQDTSNLPFSYLIEQQSTSYIVPGANLKSVGTIRDAKKWPTRDLRSTDDRLDLINFNLLSPYTIRKMIRGIGILEDIEKVSGVNTSEYTYQNGKIRRSSLRNGIRYYGLAIDKFLGNSIISRLMKFQFSDIDSLHKALTPSTDKGTGKWIDLGGMIAPLSEVTSLLDDIESGEIRDVATISSRLGTMHSNYYEYEWTWAFETIKSFYGIDLSEASVEVIEGLVRRWLDSVIELDNMLLEDAKKEFSLTAMTSFGADGSQEEMIQDFRQVRGTSFDKDPFVLSTKTHIKEKTSLGSEALERLSGLTR